MPPLVGRLLLALALLAGVFAGAEWLADNVLPAPGSPGGTAAAYGLAAAALALWARSARLVVRAGAVRAWFWLVAWAAALVYASIGIVPAWGLEPDPLPVAGVLALAASGAGTMLAAVSRSKAVAARPVVERGTSVVEAAVAQKAIWGRTRPGAGVIRFGGLSFPPGVETRHLLLSGSTGSGKTQALHRVVSAVRDRGGRALVADSGAEFLSRYAYEGDVVLNPFDARSAEWSPFAEIEAPYDAARIAAAAIPEREGAGGEWNHYARSLLGETLGVLHARGEHSMRELLRVLTAAEPGELAELLGDTPAAVLASEGNDRMLASVRGIVATYLGAWRFLPDRGGFSVRGWIRDEAAGWLWLPYRDDQLALLRHLAATWIDLAAVEALTLGESAARDLWIVLDELDSLGKVASLDQGLAKGRKYGLRIVMGCQTVAQLRATYGRDTAQTISANAGSKLLLRAGDHETAQYFAGELGDQDIARQTETVSDRGAAAASRSTSIQRSRQAAVMPAELLALPDLCGYLSLAGFPAVVRLQLDVLDVPRMVEPFVAASAAGEANQ